MVDCFAQRFLADNFPRTDCINRLRSLFVFPSRDFLLTWVTQVQFLQAFWSLFANTLEAVQHWILGFPLPCRRRQIMLIQTLQCRGTAPRYANYFCKTTLALNFLNPSLWPANLWSLLFTWLLRPLIGAPVCFHPSRDKRRWRGSRGKG